MPNELDDEVDLNDDLLEDDVLENDENVDLDDDEGDDKGKQISQLTPQQIAELAARTAAGMQPKQTQQTQQLTPEEIDAKLHRYKVSPEIVKLLRDPEVAPEKIVEALQGLVDGAAKHAVASSQLLYQNDLSPLQQQIQAMENFRVEQQTKQFVKNVSSQFPALARFENVIRQATDMVRQSGYQPKSHTDARRQVALQAQQIIRTIDPQFSLKSNPARQAGGLGQQRNSFGGRSAPAGGKTGAASFVEYL